jgi:hypothetical protein
MENTCCHEFTITPLWSPSLLRAMVAKNEMSTQIKVLIPKTHRLLHGAGDGTYY